MKKNEIVGVLLRGEPYNRNKPLDSTNWIWLTLYEMNTLLKEQKDFGARGKCYWKDDRVFSLADLQVARVFSLEELERMGWKPKQYVLDRLEYENGHGLTKIDSGV